jgi:hypothetical protein
MSCCSPPLSPVSKKVHLSLSTRSSSKHRHKTESYKHVAVDSPLTATCRLRSHCSLLISRFAFFCVCDDRKGEIVKENREKEEKEETHQIKMRRFLRFWFVCSMRISKKKTRHLKRNQRKKNTQTHAHVCEQQFFVCVCVIHLKKKLGSTREKENRKTAKSVSPIQVLLARCAAQRGWSSLLKVNDLPPPPRRQRI